MDVTSIYSILLGKAFQDVRTSGLMQASAYLTEKKQVTGVWHEAVAVVSKPISYLLQEKMIRANLKVHSGIYESPKVKMLVSKALESI